MIAFVDASYVTRTAGLTSVSACVFSWMLVGLWLGGIVRSRKSRRRSMNEPHILQDHTGTNIRCVGRDSRALVEI